MYYVYFLTHRRCVEGDDVYDTKVLGIYTAKSKALSAIDFFREKEGFCDYKEDFYIKRKKLLGNREKPISSVFLIEYERFLYDRVYHKEFLGICADEKTADVIVALSKERSHYPEGTEEYEVIEYVLDRHSEYWSEGFN